tara:strand:- start:643 stop:1716 length:1074 start_codon:yes stop_codon:yes gene_type:complete
LPSSKSARTIAFVAGNKAKDKMLQDPAFIYRCENPALALEAQGHDVTLIHLHDLARSAKRFDIVIFHRPHIRDWRTRWHMRRVIRRLKKQRSFLIADFDDLVFSPEFAQFSPGYVNDLVSLKQTQKNFAAHQKTLHHFDAFTLSTQPLLEAMQQQVKNANAHLLPNSPHVSWQRQHAEINAAHPNEFIIKYLPGTRSHDRDFAQVYAPLAMFLNQHPNAKLKITGVIDEQRIRECIECNPTQLIFEPKRPFSEYAHVVNDGHVHIAPLEHSVFNDCKSALKAIEAGFYQRPIIATPIPDMLRLEHAGVILANSDKDWLKALERCFKSKNAFDYRFLINDIYNADQHARDLLSIAHAN